jgi:accessory colonization factor AcfC
MKMTIKMILPALLLAFASVAYAEDITLYSSGGTSNFTNGTLQYLGTSPLAYV